MEARSVQGPGNHCRVASPAERDFGGVSPPGKQTELLSKAIQTFGVGIMLHARERYAVSITLRALVLFLFSAALVGCGGQAPSAKSASENRATGLTPSDSSAAQRNSDENAEQGVPPAPAAGPPGKRILFQPMFTWLGAEPTYQGTGFFAKAPNGKIAAVSSAHFLDRDGPALLEAKWLEVPTGKPVASFTRSWGVPGHAGTRRPVVDLRSDYLLMPAPEAITADLALELDSRPRPKRDERIWFPDKDDSLPLGYRVVAGTVVESEEKYSAVVLDKEITLQSQSGSPFISQATGRVIGTLSGADLGGDKPRLLLTPASGILAALARDKDFPELRSVIGKHRLAPNR